MIKYAKKAGLISKNLDIEHLHIELFEVVDIDHLPIQGCFFVVLDGSSLHITEHLKQLRQRTHFTTMPVFYTNTPHAYHAALFDGPFDEQSPLIAKNIHARMRQVSLPTAETKNDLELLVVRYLYVRGYMSLKGQINHHSPFGLQYPILDLFTTQKEALNHRNILQSMVKKGLLKQGPLMDELQTCPHCEAGLLNFKNTCPACYSIQIKKQSFVHCFSCGNIDVQSAFLNHDQMKCNRCQTSLRHIGIDYDRPIEDKRCMNCQHDFLETHVNTYCMVCTKLSDPATLETRPVFDYILDTQGEQLAKRKEIKTGVIFNAFSKHVDRDLFITSIHWQTQLARRHSSIHFSLISLMVKNKTALISAHGTVKTEKILAEFHEQVLLLLREGDLVTQYKHTLFFFLPMTSTEGYQVIIDKITTFAHASEKIDVGVGILLSKDIIDNNIDMNKILDELHIREKEHV